MGMFSAHVAHNLDAKKLNHQPKGSFKADGVYPNKKITLSKCFGYQNGENIRCHHVILVRRSGCSGGSLPQEKTPFARL